MSPVYRTQIGRAPANPTYKKKPALKAPGAALKPSTPAPFDPYAGAQKSVDEMISTLLASVEREKAAAYAQAQREAQLELAKGQAIAEGLKRLGISESVQRAFQSAATAQSGLAQGFSGGIRDQATAQAAEQQRMLSGTGQEGAVRNEGDAMGNVQYGVNGFIPGTELNTIGAAFGADAALQPGFAMQFGAINEALRRQKWSDEELPQWTDRIMEVYDKKPGLLQDAYDNVFDQQLAARKAKQDADEFSYKQWSDQQNRSYKAKNDAANRKLKAAGVKWDQRVDVARLSQSGQRISQAQESLNLRAQQYAASNAQAWARIGISDKNAQISAARNELAWKKYKSGDKKNSGMTAAQAQRYRRDAGKLAALAWNGKPAGKDEDGNNLKDYMSYQEAMRVGLSQGIPLSAMQSALNTFWSKPGLHTPRDAKPGSGRPKVPFQLRQPAKPGKGVQVPTRFSSTHKTDNLGWPAVDIMGKPGTPVKAPEDGVIVRHGSAQGGQALYFRARSGKTYWLGHIDGMLPVGTRVRRGQRIASISGDHARPHVHVAVDRGVNA